MNKILDAFGIILSIIMTIILTGLIIIFCLLLNAKNYFDEVNVGRILSDTDISNVLYLADKDMHNNFSELLENNGIDESLIENVLNGTKLKETLSVYISSLYESVINDNEIVEITKDDLTTIIEEAIDTVNLETEDSITNTTKGEILDLVDENSEKILSLLPKEEQIKDMIEENKEIEIIKVILNSKTLAIILGVIILVLGLIALLRFSYYKWIAYLGISLGMSSSFYIALYVASFITNYEIILENELLTYIVNILLNNLISNFFITGIILLLLTIFSILIINNIKKSNNKKVKKEELIEG